MYPVNQIASRFVTRCAAAPFCCTAPNQCILCIDFEVSARPGAHQQGGKPDGLATARHGAAHQK
jgi:hypothetical protein